MTMPTDSRPPGLILPTTVVGSYSVPEWLERLKTEYYQRRISAAPLAEIHEVAIKAAVKTGRGTTTSCSPRCLRRGSTS